MKSEFISDVFMCSAFFLIGAILTVKLLLSANIAVINTNPDGVKYADYKDTTYRMVELRGEE